ncbi:CCAAT/enhancer-binding protein zeta [Morus notabilis]|uniref:CCAAT/enhancer-binding protein zeta n=1 Tax=Morus notabilis TaxID=981085 RepID=UPI000CED6872|nr:CCAAT/enhancer-binding protein zeta [Morus notabilis]
MAVSKSKKSSTDPEDLELLKTDVASFASSLGLSSSLPSSGFNDVDFRKTGPLPPTRPQKKQKQSPAAKSTESQNPRDRNSRPGEKPKPKPPVLSLDNGNGDKHLGFEKFKNMPKLPLMKASALGVWYADQAELETKVVGKEKKVEARNLNEWKSFVEKKRELGERLMAQYAKDYESSRGQSGDIKMLYATQRSGTVTDKVSAFSVLVGDNPVANLRSLDALLGMVSSKVGKRHALTGFEALKELFISSLLPDRMLKSLLQRPLNHLPETKDGYSLLLFWYWEECLKQRYERYIFALEEASRDMLPVLKNKAVKIIETLLKSKSEQERRLLSALVNKLGDPENKGASNADFHLSELLRDHPNMTAVVIDEVDSFLFRPHLGIRAKYHAVNFLSKIRLYHKKDGPNVAKRLIDVYFALFKVLISEVGDSQEKDKSHKPGDGKDSRSFKHGKTKHSSESHVELDSRLLSVLLTGVNRAFPYVSTSDADDIIEVQTPMLFQLVHSDNFNVGIQALMLLYKISSKNQVVSDRFYRALYAKLLLPAAMNSSKAEMFIGLLLKAMKSDVNLKRVAAFAKRVMQVALQQPPQYACGCLFLLSEVLKTRPHLGKMVLQSESADEEDEHFEDIVEEADDRPGSASGKQETDGEPVENGGAATPDGDSSEDDDETPVPASEDEASDEADEFLVRDDAEDVNEAKTMSGSSGKQSQASSKKSSLPGGYDPRHREPSYCNANRVSWWELTALASHVHPSVSNMANRLLKGSDIIYDGNPLNDLSLTAFLDKFMEKKPKSSTWHGGSQIEPARKLEMSNHLIGPEILSLADEDVPPEDLVFHKFYVNKINSSKKQKKKKKKKGADDEAAEELFGAGDDDESDNEEIENMLDSANISTNADGDYDYDDLDQVAEEDDEDLVGNVSDAEDADIPSDIAEEEDFDATANESDDGDEDSDIINIGDADDGGFEQRRRKRKPGKSRVSPFASLDDYEHLLNEDVPPEEEPAKKKSKKSKSRRKKKSSD